MSEAPQAAQTQAPLIVGIRFQKIGKPRKAKGSFIAQLSAVARRPTLRISVWADEAISARRERLV
jgi:hypothetical protein